MKLTPGIITLHSRAARLLAVEVLLADPEALRNDALEGDLYILREATPRRGHDPARRLRPAPPGWHAGYLPPETGGARCVQVVASSASFRRAQSKCRGERYVR
jgi:hypothetical protein